MQVAAARAAMLGGVAPVGVERAPLAAALGRVLAAEVIARRDQPPFSASAMDGWAVRAADTPGRLAVVGESAAGAAYASQVGPGEAVRIFTGAAVPAGADAVVIQEDAIRKEDGVEVPAARPAQHIRPAGQDFRAGDRLLAAGVRLDPWRISLAAAAGADPVRVYLRPRVAVLATGEEIVAASGTPGPSQIFDSGGPALAALIESWGGTALPLGRVGDDVRAIIAMVADCQADLIITLGGASVGDHDLVKPALSELGLALAVESIAMRPGKPTWFGRLGDGRRILGLPGNPASALVAAELFARPLIAALVGAEAEPRLIPARTGVALAANGAREHWLRASLAPDGEGRLTASPLSDQDSSLASVFARADALMRRPPGAAEAKPGEIVDVLPLARL
jgi:molybdopterin molybdotransferase